MSEWIPVAKELPEPGVFVLTYTPHGVRNSDRYMIDMVVINEDCESVWDWQDASHWQPLPEPPEDA